MVVAEDTENPNNFWSAWLPRGIPRALLELRTLPPLPQAVTELSAVLDDDQASYATLARVIGRAPTLAARILGVANSAFFGRAGRIRGLEDAIRLLGLSLVRALVLGTVLGRRLDTTACPAFDSTRFWLSALASALAARYLAGFALIDERPSPDLAYLGGLLHRLGLLALVHLKPSEMDVLFNTANADSLCDRESHHFGFNHRQVGAWIAWRWRLPGPLRIAASHYAELNYRGPDWALSGVVGLASQCSAILLSGLPDDQDAQTPLGAVLGLESHLCAKARDALSRELELLCEGAHALGEGR